MKKKQTIFSLFFLTAALFLLNACTDNKNEDNGSNTINTESVRELKAELSSESNQVNISWINTDNPVLNKVEVTYRTKSITGPKKVKILDALGGNQQEIQISLPDARHYLITVTPLTNDGIRAMESIVETKLEGNEPIPTFLQRADTLMSSMYDHFMQDRDYKGIWRDKADLTSGMAALWGQGSALSGYTTIRRASSKYPDYQLKYGDKLADELFDNGIEKFRTQRDDVIEGLEAYACFPGQGNERFYDDDVWVALDMVDMYEQTHNEKYKERAELIWRFLMSGYDLNQGGGIYWKEQDRNSKNVCSTAPTAVMAAKMYLLTGEEQYKDMAIKLFDWLVNTLQDPIDHLFYDNINIQGSISKTKFSYNAGQPMQAAVLLYQITNDEKYLKEAQRIASAAFKHWFKTYDSPWLNETIAYIDGHTWFNAILLRGFVELYLVDKNRTYINAYEQMLSNLWLSEKGHDRYMELLNYNDFKGLTTQTEWEILHTGACVEMLAQLAILESKGL